MHTNCNIIYIMFAPVQWLQMALSIGPYRALPVTYTLSTIEIIRGSYFMLTIHLIQCKITFLALLKIFSILLFSSLFLSFANRFVTLELFDAKQFCIANRWFWTHSKQIQLFYRTAFLCYISLLFAPNNTNSSSVHSSRYKQAKCVKM